MTAWGVWLLRTGRLLQIPLSLGDYDLLGKSSFAIEPGARFLIAGVGGGEWEYSAEIASDPIDNKYSLVNGIWARPGFVRFYRRIIPNHHSVTFDSGVGAIQNGSSSLTFAHTMGAGANAYVGVFCQIQSTSAPTLTYAGTNMAAVSNTAFSGARNLSLSERVAPAAGSNNVVVPTSGRSASAAISATGVDQATPRSATATPTIGSSMAPSITISGGASGELAIAASGCAADPGVLSSDAGWTNDYSANLESAHMCAGHKTGAASVTKTDSINVSDDWAMVGASLKAASAGGLPFFMQDGLLNGGFQPLSGGMQ